jgi:4-hydroxybenzoate polyprenyltransferase
VATVLLAAGLALLVAGGATPAAAAALAATILLYDWLHKKSAATVMLMAGCRVALAAALATGPGREYTAAWLGWVTALFVYIVALSLLARAEYRPGAPAAKIGRAVGGLLAFIPFVDAAALAIVGAWGPAVVCALAVPAGKAAQRLAAAT